MEKKAKLTMSIFQRALMGALEVKMIVRRRRGIGVFSHSRLSTRSWAWRGVGRC